MKKKLNRDIVLMYVMNAILCIMAIHNVEKLVTYYYILFMRFILFILSNLTVCDVFMHNIVKYITRNYT